MATEQENELIEQQEQEEDTTKDRFLIFSIDDEEYGIEISKVNEIISVYDITRVPDTPPYVKGIINLRGNIIPVIDVRGRFLKPARAFDDLSCIVVIEHGEYTLGLIVDGVKEVMNIGEDNMQPPPSAKLAHQNQYVKSIGRAEGDGLEMILDIDKLLFG